MLRDSALQFEHIQRGHIHTREGMNQLEHEQVEEGDFDKVRRSRTLRRGSCPLLPTIKRPSRDASLIAHVTELIAQVLDFSVVQSPSKMPGLVEEGHDEEVERRQTASENSGTCAPGVEPDKSAMHSEHVDSETHLSHRIATELRRARSSSLVVPSRVHTPRYRHRSQSMAIPSNESHLLRQSVAELVLELTLEQQNSRFAATAGSALLEQLELAKEKESTLQEQLQLQQNDLDTVKNENTRLKQICHRMEVELKEYDSLWSERVNNEAGKGELKSLLLGVEAQGPSLSTITLMTCQNCEKLLKVNEQLRHEIQTLKRRCIELELQHDKAESRWSEIATLHKKSEGCLTRVQTDYTKALSDIDFMSAQIKYLKEDHCQLLASRDSIMAAGRKLQAANEELTAQLEQANDVTENLKLEKNDLNLRAQIAENRIETLTKENHAQFETTRSLLTRIHELELNQTDAHALRTHTEDLEHMVSAVQRELADVREENQRLLIRLRTQTFQGVTQTRVDESNQSMPVPHDTESNMGEILSFDMEHQESCNPDFGDIQPRSELEDQQVTQAAMSNICAANHSRAIFSSSNSDMELGSATKTSNARRSKKPSLVYTRPSIGRCHRLYTQVAPIRRRKFSENIMSTPKLPTQRLLTADDDNLDMDDEGDIMTTMSTPLCLGLSILACATAVRYIIKK